MIAAGQIRPADASPEKYIAADQEALFRRVKPDAAGGMPGQEKDGKFIIAKRYRSAGRQKDELTPVVLERHPPPQSHIRRPGQHIPLFFVEMEG